MFPEDTHALSGVQTEYEGWLTIVGWLRRHIIVVNELGDLVFDETEE
jgi:hypothetical protein